MTFKEIFNQLEGLGSERNRQIFMSRGSGQNTYGVSLVNLKKLAKGIGRDHELALALWESENVDAQCLAIMILDPAKMSMQMADSWLKKIHYLPLLKLLARVIAKTKFATIALNKWTVSAKMHVRACGFSVLSQMLKDGVEINSDVINALIISIKNEIHQSPNQVREAMNNALINMGIYREDFTEKVMDIAQRRVSTYEIQRFNELSEIVVDVIESKKC